MNPITPTLDKQKLMDWLTEQKLNKEWPHEVRYGFVQAIKEIDSGMFDSSNDEIQRLRNLIVELEDAKGDYFDNEPSVNTTELITPEQRDKMQNDIQDTVRMTASSRFWVVDSNIHLNMINILLVHIELLLSSEQALQEETKRLMGVNQSLTIDYAEEKAAHNSHVSELLQREQQLNQAVEVLKWYADKKNWNLGVQITLGSAHPLHEAVKSDKGQHARDFLSTLSKVTEEK